MATVIVVALTLLATLVVARSKENEAPVSYIDILGYGPRYIRSQDVNVLPQNPLYPSIRPLGPFLNKYVPFTLYDLYNVPLFLLAKGKIPQSYTLYYAKNGIRTVYESESFKGVFDYLKSPSEKKGLLFHPKLVFNQKLFEYKVDSTVYPDNFTLSEYMEYVQVGGNLPTLLIREGSDDLELDENGTYSVAALKMYGAFIELVVAAPEEHKPKQEQSIKVVNISDDQGKTTAARK